MLKRLLSLIGPKRRRRLLALVPVMFFGALLEMLGISLIVSVCSMLVDGDSAVLAWLSAWTGLRPGRQLTALLVGALIFIYMFKMLYLLAENRALTNFSRDFRHWLATELYSNIIHAPYEYFTGAGVAEVTNLLHSGVIQTVNYFNAFLQVVTESFVLLTVSVFLFVVNPVMTLFVLMGAALSLFLTRVLIRRRALRAGQVRRAANTARIRWMDQGVHGIKEVKSYGVEDYFCKQYSDSDWEFSKAEAAAQLLSRVPRICIEGIMVLAVLLYIVYLLVTGGDILSFLPSLSALILAALRLMPACSRINSNQTQMSYTTAAVGSICDALGGAWRHLAASDSSDSQNEKTELFDPINATSTAKNSQDTDEKFDSIYHGIAVKDVTFSYSGAAEKVLCRTGFQVPAGSAVGIVGASGAGKTTLVDIILGLLHPEHGSVQIDGHPIPPGSIAYIPQTTFILDDNIRRNVAFGIPDDQISEENVWKSLEKARLVPPIQTLDTPLPLSGGQRQRLAIARALYRDCPVLIFDESTSALDAKTEAEVLDSIYSLKGEKTIVIVSHRKSVIDRCDIVYRVENQTVRRER